jgi:hypothetical protein
MKYTWRNEVTVFKRRTAAAITIGAAVAACQPVMPEREDLQNSVMKSLSAEVLMKVDHPEISDSSCRPNGGDKSFLCDLTYRLVYKAGASVEGENAFKKTFEVNRVDGRWVGRLIAAK